MTTNYNEPISAGEKITRQQTLKAMERIMFTIGGKEGLLAWMAAMPAGVEINASGGVSNEALMAIAGDQEAYRGVMKAFAAHMGEKLTAMAEVL